MAQTLETIMGYPAVTETQLKEAMEAAVEILRADLPVFTEHFPSSNSFEGFYRPTENVEWTTGFWTGALWLAYSYTKEEAFRSAAQVQVESFYERIRDQVDVCHHDMGFLYSPSCVAAYKLTGDERAREAALLAAEHLAGRFREKGQFIQAWGPVGQASEYRLIIDCLLNLPLLYWASQETGDVRYAKIAQGHIRTAMKCILREDDSTYHTYFIDPETGKPAYGVTHQGNRDGSAWARGQAWGVYGTAIGYRYTKRAAYIPLFEGVTDYFLAHLPEDLVPFWDLSFGDGDEQPRDSSSASIAACGMLEMAKYLDGEKSAYYRKIARKLMKALADHYAVTDPAASNGLVLHSTYSNHSPYNTCNHYGVDECNIWGDYFYMEALTRLYKDWEMYW